jgi:hypothetical protein
MSDATLPVLYDRLPVGSIQEMTPWQIRAGEPQWLGPRPAGYFDMTEAKAGDELKRRQEICVTGEQDERVMRLRVRDVYQVDGKLYVDTLLLRWPVRPVAVVELPAEDLHTRITGPLCCLGVIAGSRLGLVIGVGPPAIHPDGLRRAWTSTLAGDQVGKPYRVRDAPVGFAAAAVQTVANEMHVLEVNEDCDDLGHGLSHSSGGEQKAPPVPEDGGE